MLVTLHVYDVTNTSSENTNTGIIRLNTFTRAYCGVGGVFHGGIEVQGAEWSYGFCENGSGVYCCVPKQNPMYTYRESVPLGSTSLSPSQVLNCCDHWSHISLTDLVNTQL